MDKIGTNAAINILPALLTPIKGQSGSFNTLVGKEQVIGKTYLYHSLKAYTASMFQSSRISKAEELSPVAEPM